MDRKDGYGKELFPDCDVLDQILAELLPYFFIVQVGKGIPLYHLKNISLDLVNKTSVTDLIDLAAQSDGLIGQVSGVVPLAECLNKPCLALFSSKGLRDQDKRISSITPKKICHKETSLHLIDNQKEKIKETIDLFLSLTCQKGLKESA